MPALVNIRVGSLRGTSGEDGTTAWPFRAKKSRKLDLISLTPLIFQIASGRLLVSAAFSGGPPPCPGSPAMAAADRRRVCPTPTLQGAQVGGDRLACACARSMI